MQNLEQLEQSVIQWAEEKEIFRKATPYKQAQKTLEECGELLHAIGRQEVIQVSDNEPGDEHFAKEMVMDAIGDVCVTIIIQARMQGFDLAECLQHAYDEIKNRTGKMVDGQFIKDK